MARLLRSWPFLVALTILATACFHKAIQGEQFDYRDAAHFYYPLYQRVQTEWEAGRWPLWEPEENAGIPLLGNPTAAVLYPGKLLYAALPYPLAARSYIIAHALLAVLGAYLLARRFGIGSTGAAIAGLSYGFSAPILFQYCNIVFLVGAAWTPFAFRAVDRWLRGGERSALPELAAVLALQVLGGDPQMAYLVGICAGGYAFLLVRNQAGTTEDRPRRRGFGVLVAALILTVWTAVTLLAAAKLPGLRPSWSRLPVPTFAWSPWVSLVVFAAWCLIGVLALRAWSRRKESARRLGPMLAGLAASAVLAGALSGAQLLPVMEFTRLTSRAADEGSHDFYPFSLEPVRILEFAFPNVLGTAYKGNHFWLGLIPPRSQHRIWVPSLYLGGLTLILGLSAIGFRGSPPWRKWLIGIALFSLLASFGEFGGPLFWARRISTLSSILGPPDPNDTNAIRTDGKLRDGDGSFYWILTVVLPGFQTFRYPSKLLTLTVLAMSILAGAGWELLALGGRRRFRATLALFTTFALAALLTVILAGGWIRRTFENYNVPTGFGPFQPSGAFRDLQGAVIQATVVVAVAWTLFWLIRIRPRMASALVVLCVAIDLAIANSGFVLTAPQVEFDTPPKYLEWIKQAEKANPSPGPFRIHRMPIWSPYSWITTSSEDRVLDFLRWERDTLQPKYGINSGVEYTYTQGTAELFDYEWFFGPFTQPVSPLLASQIRKISTSERVVYYPRRGFDLWNTRYFILPGYTIWTDTERGVASLLQDTEQIYPPVGAFDGPEGPNRYTEWVKTEDVQIHRNRNFMPRAWKVHEAIFLPPITGLSRAQRAQPMEEMTFANDMIWNDPQRRLYDPKKTAWLEVPNSNAIRARLDRTQPHLDDFVKVTSRDPQRVELDVLTQETALVVLADTFYPGWKLTIDGQAAEILRANRLMRGALVPGSPKVQTLVYTYDPGSFRWGLRLSIVGFVAMAGMIVWGIRRRGRPVSFASLVG